MVIFERLDDEEKLSHTITNADGWLSFCRKYEWGALNPAAAMHWRRQHGTSYTTGHDALTTAALHVLHNWTKNNRENRFWPSLQIRLHWSGSRSFFASGHYGRVTRMGQEWSIGARRVSWSWPAAVCITGSTSSYFFAMHPYITAYCTRVTSATKPFEISYTPHGNIQ